MTAPKYISPEVARAIATRVRKPRRRSAWIRAAVRRAAIAAGWTGPVDAPTPGGWVRMSGLYMSAETWDQVGHLCRAYGVTTDGLLRSLLSRGVDRVG